MKIETIYKTTKTGLTVAFGSAAEDEAQAEIDLLVKACGETRFLLSEPEDVNYTEESERAFLKRYEENPRALLLNAYVDGKLVGNASFDAVNSAPRLGHRASLGIALLAEYCDQGIGELMLRILLDRACECGYELMELDVFAANVRAIHLYEKLGFVYCGSLKNAVKFKDGSYTDLVFMQKKL